jgi:hypothetical protein
MSSTFDYPRVQRTSDSLVVEFSPKASDDKAAQMPMVLDFNRFGDIIAIEMISIKHYGGPNLFQALDLHEINEASDIRFTYDDTCDSSWLVLDKDRSLDQRCVDGRLMINRSGQLVAIEVPLG